MKRTNKSKRRPQKTETKRTKRSKRPSTKRIKSQELRRPSTAAAMFRVSAEGVPCPSAVEVDRRVRKVLHQEKPNVPERLIHRSGVLRDRPLLFTDAEVEDLAGPLNVEFVREALALSRDQTGDPSITTMGKLSDLVFRELPCNQS